MTESPSEVHDQVARALFKLTPLSEQNEVLAAVRKLEALRPYVQHRSTCILNISQSPLREASWCDCGLTELLSDD